MKLTLRQFANPLLKLPPSVVASNTTHGVKGQIEGVRRYWERVTGIGMVGLLLLWRVLVLGLGHNWWSIGRSTPIGTLKEAVCKRRMKEELHTYQAGKDQAIVKGGDPHGLKA